MGIYDGYLILSDIDGTLTCDTDGSPMGAKDTISDENLRSLHRFMDNGGYFSLVTGRTSDFLKTFPIQPNAPLISVNGTLSHDAEGKRILYLPMEECAAVLRELIEQHPQILGVSRSEEHIQRIWSRAEQGDDWRNLTTGDPCLRYFFLCEDEAAALALMDYAVRRYGDRYEFDRSWPNGLEMHEKGSGKSAGLRFLREYLPGVHTTVAVGNYENDISMIREADLGCAVENALPSVKAVARYIVPAHTEHALSYIIETLIPAHKAKQCKNIR